MSAPFRVSQSKVKTFRRCHQAYAFRYIDKLRKKRKPRALQFGTMIHEGLERYCNGKDPLDYIEELEDDVAAMKLFAQEREEYGDILEDVADILDAYAEYWEATDDENVFVRKAKRQAEHSFDIEIFPNVIFNGKIDFVLQTPNKLRWLGEHKTYSRKPGEDERWRNLQSTVYFRANDILGWEPLDGVLWDYIRSKAPAVPGVLQDGSLSTKKIDTLPSTVRRYLEAPDYKDATKPAQKKTIISMAEANMGNYFERIHTPVNRSVADYVWDDFERSVREMVDKEEKGSNHWGMNIDRHCGWCDYEPLCRARLQGNDIDYIKQREYTNGSQRKKDKDDDEKPPVHVKSHEEVLAGSKKRQRKAPSQKRRGRKRT